MPILENMIREKQINFLLDPICEVLVQRDSELARKNKMQKKALKTIESSLNEKQVSAIK